MTLHQLPEHIREFASYFKGLLARVDQGAGWCGVFWQRDPEGMRACLDGREVPPWDVLEALLQDLAADQGARVARMEVARARALHAAALAAFDARPGGREILGDRLDAMLGEQRYAADRRLELSRLLDATEVPEEAEGYRRDLAWAQDDHERATARCAELRARVVAYDRLAGPVRTAPSGWEGGRISSGGRPGQLGRPAPGRPAPRDGQRGPGGAAEPTGSDARPARVGRQGREHAAPAATGAPGGVPEHPYAARPARAYRSGPDGERTPADADSGRQLRSGARPAPSPYAPGTPGGTPLYDPRGHTVPAPGGPYTPPGSANGDPNGGPYGSPSGLPAERAAPTPQASAPRPAADLPTPEPPAGAADPGPAADAPGAGEPTADEPPPAPSPRRGLLQRSRRLRGARSAGADDTGEPTGGMALPQGGGKAPRGARFAGATPRRTPDAAPDPDAEARQATVAAVESLVRLRAEGRGGEAHGVLVEAAYGPADRFPLLAVELHRAGLAADWATLLWEAASLPVERLVSIADSLAAAGRTDDGALLLRQGVGRPPAEIGEVITDLIGEGRRREARALVDAYVRVRTPEEIARCAGTDPGRLVPLLLDAAGRVSEQRRWDLVHALRVAGLDT
ncbi:hypothetical protein ACFV0R_30215 [Streptomyces sp. NPDC059578]|uniref:hypothetical protein n=1 Tax=unclassified Streptomyces TaxID=2593676 RepID=UPI00365A5A97